ncbi:MAG: hypothetical protein KGZ65_00100 [Sphingomonadales bacterium]|nr:hypothetical protein [Sphingomonadaceae bacterium]MBS3929607.1 hypothetical protein [Sphingomonadales bacterium]
MASKVQWEGDKVFSEVGKATALGIDQILAKCVIDAKTEHAFENRTGVLEGSIRSKPAETVGTRMVGEWGSFSVEYALYVELLEGYGFLRPQADKHYPNLAEQIRKNLGT